MTITKNNRNEYLNSQTSAYKFGWESCEKGDTQTKKFKRTTIQVTDHAGLITNQLIMRYTTNVIRTIGNRKRVDISNMVILGSI